MPKKPADAPNPPQEGPDHLGLERLIFFSDAVFAIAITLLALDIRLPDQDGFLTDAQLAQSLLAIWPKYLGYVVSFLVIGYFWISHHRKFRWIRQYDRRLLLFNLLFLMAVAFIPFPTAVLSNNGNRSATIFYALAMIPPSIFSIVLWVYASHQNRLTDAQLDRRRRQREIYIPLSGSFIFLLSIGLAFLNPDLAKYSWGLVALIPVIMQ